MSDLDFLGLEATPSTFQMTGTFELDVHCNGDAPDWFSISHAEVTAVPNSINLQLKLATSLVRMRP